MIFPMARFAHSLSFRGPIPSQKSCSQASLVVIEKLVINLSFFDTK